MMTSYFNLLKYAATGIASPDMTYYGRMRASTLMGGTVQTLTGIPPLTFKADGSPLISLSMKGNGQQTGTPSPDNIIMPTFCGVRTPQLFEGYFSGSIGATGGIAYNDQYEVYYARVTAGATYTISGGYYVYAYYSDIPSAGTSNSVDNTRHFTSQGNVITVIEGATWIGVRVNSGDKPMINSGNIALPYEPFGWAEKITCAGQTTPVYLGQTQTVRKIKKLVLDGTESWSRSSSNGTLYTSAVTDYLRVQGVTCMCSHYTAQENARGTDGVNSMKICFSYESRSLYIRDTSYTSADAWKAYLAAQYAAGTPVTIWYVLAAPETGIVNEPLCKIGDYADELHSTDAGVSIPTIKGSNTLTVEAELQPSEMTITYKG